MFLYEDFQGKPVGSVRCVLVGGNATFQEDTVSWIDCSKSLNEITEPQEQAQAVATITAQPDNLEADQVVDIVNTISDISQEPEIEPAVQIVDIL